MMCAPVAALLVLTPVTGALAQPQRAPTVPETMPPTAWTVQRLESRPLGESRGIMVSTPAEYAGSTRRYPVLLLHDAHDTTMFRAALANVRFLTDRGVVPPLLVVGIPKGADRTRDLTPPSGPDGRSGRADKFLDFVEHEVMPLVRQRYRTAPYLVYAGHSLGGLAGLWAAATRPHLFHAVVAMSPSLWWDAYRYPILLADSIGRRTMPLRLFTSRGGAESDIDSSTTLFEQRLTKRLAARPAVIHYSHRFYPDAFHMLTPQASLIDGLRAVFATYSVATNEFQRLRPAEWTDSVALMRAFLTTEDKWRISARDFPVALVGDAALDSVPTEAVYLASVNFAARRHPGAAVAMGRRAAARYPTSAAVLRTLGERLRDTKDTSGAAEAFRSALRTSRSKDDSTEVRRAAGALLTGTISPPPQGGRR